MTVVGRWALSRMARLGGLVTSSVSGFLGALVLAAIQRLTHYKVFRTLLMSSKVPLGSCSQGAAGAGRWLLMAVRGYLGGTPWSA